MVAVSFKEAIISLSPKSSIKELLIVATEHNCSDLMIKVGEKACFFRFGQMHRANVVIDEATWVAFADEAISNEMNSIYVREKFIDFSYSLKRVFKEYRYRVNASFSENKNVATFRMISTDLPTFKSLKIDKCVTGLLEKALRPHGGIVLINGVTGSGKTSTLAACINEFSLPHKLKSPLKDANLITLEDPIEYRFGSTSSTRVIQKEYEKDFLSFSGGIKSALREHPTHILIGETRDKETINALVAAARTGHTCVSTFHTSSVSDTISRLYSYLIHENESIMFDLIDNLNFVICQKLSKGYSRFELDYQYMFFTTELKKLLKSAISKNENIPTLVERLIADERLINAGICRGWGRE